MKVSFPVGYIQEQFFPHPFAPLLASFGMTGWTKSPTVTRKHQQPLQATIFTLNPCKPVLRITAIKVFIHDICHVCKMNSKSLWMSTWADKKLAPNVHCSGAGRGKPLPSPQGKFSFAAGFAQSPAGRGEPDIG